MYVSYQYWQEIKPLKSHLGCFCDPNHWCQTTVEPPKRSKQCECLEGTKSPQFARPKRTPRRDDSLKMLVTGVLRRANEQSVPNSCPQTSEEPLNGEGIKLNQQCDETKPKKRSRKEDFLRRRPETTSRPGAAGVSLTPLFWPTISSSLIFSSPLLLL